MPLPLISKLVKAFTVARTLNPLLLRSLIGGVAASSEHFQFLSSLGPIDTVIDVGANRGQFSLAVRYALPEASIFAFEPLPGPCRKLRNIFHADTNTEIFNTAIGMERSVASIHISGRDDSSSLLPISNTQNQLFPGTAEVAVDAIQVDRLDAALAGRQLGQRTLLKIDVQGYEYQVLKGSEHLLDIVTFIYVECSFIELYESQALAHEIIVWLQQHDFILNGIFNVSYDPHHRAIQADFLFRNSAHVVSA